MNYRIWVGFLFFVLINAAAFHFRDRMSLKWHPGGSEDRTTVPSAEGRIIAQSGDGKDLLPDGKPAPLIAPGTIPSSAPCGMGWICDNPLGLAPNPPPSSVRFKRVFDLSEKDLGKGPFVLTFKADDKAEFFLNGASAAMAACTPPTGNDGECQQYCHEFVLPVSAFRAGPNELDIVLTNLFNVPVKDKFGWSELSYQLKLRVGSGSMPPASGRTPSAPGTVTY